MYAVWSQFNACVLWNFANNKNKKYILVPELALSAMLQG